MPFAALMFVLIGAAPDPTKAPALATRDVSSSLAAFAERAVHAGIAPGIVIGVVTDGQTFIVGAGRTSDADLRRPDADTLFEIGSITKTMTATLLADMVVRKQVTLDTPLADTWPGFPVRADSVPVRLVDLATHHSGFPPLPPNFHPADPANPYADYTLEALDAALRTHGVTKAAAAETDGAPSYQYSNFAAAVLGQALAKRGGHSFEELIVGRVLTPLGMNDTRLTQPGSRATPHQLREAGGHDVEGDPAVHWEMLAMAPAGAVRSTARDMIRYARAQLDPPRVLAAAIALTHKPQADAPHAGKVALGWHLTPDGTLWHNGETGAFHSYMGIDLIRRRAVIVLANQANAAVDAVGTGALKLLSGKSPALPVSPPELALPDAALDACVGNYILKPGVTLAVTRGARGLYAQLTGQAALRLHASDPTTFSFRAVAAQLRFTLGVDGRATMVTLVQNGQEIPAARAP